MRARGLGGGLGGAIPARLPGVGAHHAFDADLLPEFCRDDLGDHVIVTGGVEALHQGTSVIPDQHRVTIDSNDFCLCQQDAGDSIFVADQ